MHLDLFEDLPLAVPFIEKAPLADLDVFLEWYGIDNVEYRDSWRKILSEQFNYRPRVPEKTFQGGEVLYIDSLTVEVIPCPGHTPGHLAFFFKEPAVLFMGDYDLGKFGPWYGDRGSSIEDTIASLAKLRQIPARTWITGHETGLFETDPGEAWDRYLNIIEEREQKLLAYLIEPRTLDEIVSQWIIYQKPREPTAFFEFGERSLIGKHLERLLSKGRIQLAGDRYLIR
jgi:glyoxylase-like metal-dependent hydrolase (beta-lactamase superfamily II)